MTPCIARSLLVVIACAIGASQVHADEALDVAVRGQAGDAVTTAASVLVKGAVELNPLGVVGVLVVKPIAVAHVNKLQEPQRTDGLTALGAAGVGLTVNNVCVFAAIALEVLAHGMTVGQVTALCMGSGAAVGIAHWRSTQGLRDAARGSSVGAAGTSTVDERYVL